MQLIKRVTFLILLLFISACSSVHSDFFQNFTKDSRKAAGSSSSLFFNLKYNDNENLLIVGRESGSIDIWDTNKASSKREIKAHAYPVNSITFTSDGGAFFSSSYFENSTKLWDAKSGALLHLVRDMRGPVAVAPGKQFYVVANGDHFRLFDYTQKLLLPAKYPCGGIVTVIAVDSASGQIAFGTESGSIELWKYSEFKGIPALKKISGVKPYQFGDWVVGLYFSSSGSSLYSIARFGSIDEWSSSTLEKRRSVPTILKQVYSTAYLRDKDFLALAGTAEKVGSGPGSAEIISLIAGTSKTYRVNTNLAVVEFLPPISSFIAAQSNSTSIYALP